MSGRPSRSLSRRSFAALALQALALWSGRARAQDPMDGADRGLGGTGAAPTDAEETLGRDRGIGGTGVIGTIRRFGSIVVNDLRVTFPPDVPVSIDGRPAAARDLRLGQVVRVLARQRGGVLVTRAIVADSEVVGPVGASGPGRLVVLGQRVLVPEGVAVPAHRAGDLLAVSGLRRLDGAVVASLIERRPPGPSRLRGPVEAGADGGPAVGGLAVAGLAPALIGRRVSMAGALRNGTFHPSAVTVEPRVPFAEADAVSVEAYVARVPDGLRLGSGLDVAASPAALAELGEQGGVRAVVVARPIPAGRLAAQSLHVEAGPRGTGRDGLDRGPAAPGARGPAGPGGAAAPGPGNRDGGSRDGGPRGGNSPGGGAGGGRGGPGR
ncbi:hypothetical protein [Lichenibacterium dinghuense]|uniref:hypothetical protein n=1 Tax=Lichenibacterium dinghuense TaxID=2895977 RepID=UPI001F2FE55F|nr:hypothetical protein [Lichenibacterium sp. 6Y81]